MNDVPPGHGQQSVDGHSPFERLLEKVRALPLKQRVRLLETIGTEAVVERQQGIRVTVASTSEYKRVKKGIHETLVAWIGTFDAGETFYDIGANTGFVSLLASRMHETRVSVFAFEPAFDNYASLVRNVLTNGLMGAITPVPVALLDETGIKPLYRSRLGPGSALHAVGQPLDYQRLPFAPAAVEQVLAYRLDDFVRAFDLPLPVHIKLDVDGFEQKVLAGATGLLSSGVCRSVCVELVEAEPGDPHPRCVEQQLLDLGFDVAHVVEHRAPGVYPRIVDALFQRRAA